MGLQKNLLKIFKIIFPFTDFVYILQQEEYGLQRITFWFPRFFFKRNFQNRDSLVYTHRANAILVVSVFLFCMINMVYLSLSAFVLSCLLIPVIVLVFNIVLAPVFAYLKKRIIKKATAYFREVKKNTKVIAITGSYGKTSVKNYIEQLVKSTYKVTMIPGNVNSVLGISNWILKEFKKGTEILIVEMDAYEPGEIKESTLLVDPDIAIITNIGDQHLQRYKTKEKLADALLELFKYSSSNTLKITEMVVENEVVEANLSDTHRKNLQFAVYVAKALNVPKEYIDHLSKNIVGPDRRQAKKNLFGFEVIDDSYNISFTTASAAIAEARNQANLGKKKLLVITAGIPELSEINKEKNKELGMMLYTKADKIFVLKSIFHKEILSGVHSKEKVALFKDFKQAISTLQSKYSPEEWFVLIQPELTDIYY